MNATLTRWVSFFTLAGGLALAGPAPGRGGDTWPSLHNGGNTSISAANLPVEWSPDRGVAWAVELPGYGQSAPVVWDGQVYVTAIDGDHKETCYVHAYDAKTGRRLWEHRFAATVRVRNSYMTSRAAPTPVADRDGVYALFESGDLHALTHAGKKRWAVTLFDNAERKFDNAHGYGASPTQTARAVVVLVDHRGPSYLLALAKETGEPLWKTERKSRSSWTSPQVTRVDGREQVVVSSSGTVDGYDAETGKQLWSHTGLSGNNIPSVTVQGDRVYVGAGISQREKDESSAAASNVCLRITPDAKAGVEVAWQPKKAVCHYVSPLVHRGYAYYLNQAGVLSCLDAATGKEVYAERTGGPCWAQPIAAGDHIYLFHKDGVATVLKAGPRFEIVARNRLWKEESPPRPRRSYEYEPQGPNDTRPRKPEAHYQDPIVYGVAAVDGAFFGRLGTHLYSIRVAAEAKPLPRP
jgi:outer membrane protein assembly factor BamB